MTLENIRRLLKQYGDLNGALLLGLSFDLGKDILSRTVSIDFKAYDSLLESAPKDNWKRIRITAIGRAIFSWRENAWNSNLVLNDAVIAFEVEHRTLVDFDPLHAAPCPNGNRLSDFFLGGAELNFEEMEPIYSNY
jgi:hypothetical protein